MYCAVLLLLLNTVKIKVYTTLYNVTLLHNYGSRSHTKGMNIDESVREEGGKHI
jgi:hypothetical protein